MPAPRRPRRRLKPGTPALAVASPATRGSASQARRRAPARPARPEDLSAVVAKGRRHPALLRRMPTAAPTPARISLRFEVGADGAVPVARRAAAQRSARRRWAHASRRSAAASRSRRGPRRSRSDPASTVQLVGDRPKAHTESVAMRGVVAASGERAAARCPAASAWRDPPRRSARSRPAAPAAPDSHPRPRRSVLADPAARRRWGASSRGADGAVAVPGLVGRVRLHRVGARHRDAHHRASGVLAVEGRPVSWLGLGLRLDGRYDQHTVGRRAATTAGSVIPASSCGRIGRSAPPSAPAPDWASGCPAAPRRRSSSPPRNARARRRADLGAARIAARG